MASLSLKRNLSGGASPPVHEKRRPVFGPMRGAGGRGKRPALPFASSGEGNGLVDRKERRVGAMTSHGDSPRLDPQRSGLEIDRRPARRIRRIGDVTAAKALDRKDRHQRSPGHVDGQIPLRHSHALQGAARREIAEEHGVGVMIRKLRASREPGLIIVMAMRAIVSMSVSAAVRMVVRVARVTVARMTVPQVDMVPAVVIALPGGPCVHVRHRLPHQAKRNQQQGNDAGHSTVIDGKGP